MQVIETLISEARQRQIVQTQAYRVELERRADDAARALEEQFCRAFGADLIVLLDAEIESAIDTPAHLHFVYQAHDYTLRASHYDSVTEWHLTRMDPRADDDERRRPAVSFTEHRRDVQANIDAFVLALADLDQEQNVPWPLRPAAPAPKRPSAEERLISALVELMRGIAADSHIE